MECFPNRGYFFNNAYYLRISTEQHVNPTIVTGVFEFDEVNFTGVNNEKIMFVIGKSKSEELWSCIMQAEQAVAMMIRDLAADDNKFWPRIPHACKYIFEQNHMTSSLVRSNYWPGSEDYDATFYLKGNTSTIVCTDFSDKPIDIKQLGQGKYQFEIKSNLVYFGEHADKTCMANLQLRISRIRFTPLTSILETDTSYDESKWNPLQPPETFKVSMMSTPYTRKKRESDTSYDETKWNPLQPTEMSKVPLLSTPCTRKKRVSAPDAPKKIAKRNCIPSK